VATVVCHVVWLRRLLDKLTGEEAGLPTLMVDNQPAIALAKNPTTEASISTSSITSFVIVSMEDRSS